MIEDATPDAAKAGPPRARVTLDGQLVAYWEREAQRLDTLAAGARWGWIARRHARRAMWARAQGARSAAREAEREV